MEAPETLPGDQIFLNVFSDLGTERLYEGGPIPLSAVRDYARDELEMDAILERVFTTTIREMDLLYLSWMAEEREKSMKSKRPPPAKDQKAQHRKRR